MSFGYIYYIHGQMYIRMPCAEICLLSIIYTRSTCLVYRIASVRESLNATRNINIGILPARCTGICTHTLLCKNAYLKYYYNEQTVINNARSHRNNYYTVVRASVCEHCGYTTQGWSGDRWFNERISISGLREDGERGWTKTIYTVADEWRRRSATATRLLS